MLFKEGPYQQTRTGFLGYGRAAFKNPDSGPPIDHPRPRTYGLTRNNVKSGGNNQKPPRVRTLIVYNSHRGGHQGTNNSAQATHDQQKRGIRGPPHAGRRVRAHAASPGAATSRSGGANARSNHPAPREVLPPPRTTAAFEAPVSRASRTSSPVVRRRHPCRRRTDEGHTATKASGPRSCLNRPTCHPRGPISATHCTTKLHLNSGEEEANIGPTTSRHRSAITILGAPAGAHLDETVAEVLNPDIQASLPYGPACGPDPQAYKETLDKFWPHASGEGWSNFQDFVRTYDAVRAAALPNYLAARIPLHSGLKIKAWRSRLTGYHDKDLLDLMEYGFPANYIADGPPSPTHHNHKEDPSYHQHIVDYVAKEVRMGALLGPFKVPPFTPWTQCSPMMTRPKSDPMNRRVIVDLSHPPGKGVNAGIPRKEYLGRPQTYTLPSIQNVAERIRDLGEGCFMWSADISRAYRQIRSDPLSAPLFGITLGSDFYIDTALPFGCRTSGAACVRVTNAFAWIMRQAGFNVEVYVDDFIGCEETEEMARQAYNFAMALGTELGLDFAPNKCCPPAQQLTWLGFGISSTTMRITIPELKLADILAECERWMTRPTTTRKLLQSLIGKLVHISSCIPPGRKFICRILAALREARHFGTSPVGEDLRMDVNWFRAYARQSNGIYIIPPRKRPEWTIECDSCLTGGGAHSPVRYFRERYKDAFTSRYPAIHELEALNLIAAVRHLGPDAAEGATVIVNTDNAASAAALESGRATDPTLAACSREMWLLAAHLNVNIEIRHKPGVDLVLADALSRYHCSKSAVDVVNRHCNSSDISRIRVSHELDLLTMTL